MRPLIDAQQEAWRNRVLPPVTRVADGMWSIPVPCEPFSVRYTYCYVIEGGGDLVVVDPGLDTGAGWTALREGLAQAGHTPADVTGVVISHFHPDHSGMASRLAQESRAWVAAHESEIELIRTQGSPTTEGLGRLDARWLVATGAPDSEREPLRLRALSAPYFRAGDLPDRALADGEEIRVGDRALVVLRTPGHTPGHICLVDEQAQVVLTGDHVLPGISPNVGLHTVSDSSDPLADYLKALDVLAAYDDFAALPAHEFAFRGLSRRANELARHHLHRAEQIMDVIAHDELTTWQIAERVSWSRAWGSFTPLDARLALAETLAHVRRWERIGRVSVRGDETWWVSRVPSGRSSA